MRAGVSYLINLANKTEGACVSGALFAPGTSSFEEGSPLLHIGCGGYRLFTPGPGEGGRYSFEVTPRTSHRGIQRFHLQVAPAGPAETAPGLALGNYAHAHGRLDGRGVSVLRLYRLDVTSHSNLTLKLIAPGSADFNLQLRNQNGNVIECQCGGSGSQTLQHQLRPAATTRSSPSATPPPATSRSCASRARSPRPRSRSHRPRPRRAKDWASTSRSRPPHPAPSSLRSNASIPSSAGSSTARRKPLSAKGSASVPFSPPAVGRWRAKATYAGSRISSPSAVGFSYLLVS